MELSSHYLPEDPLHPRGQFLCQVQADSSCTGGWESIHLARLQRKPRSLLTQLARCTSGWGRCSTKLLATSIQLGGPGGLVQIDESLFRHKPKVRSIAINIMPYMVHSLWRLKHKSLLFIKSYKHCFFPLCSTTEEEPPTMRCGFLGWLTCPSIQPWVHGGGSGQDCCHPSPNQSEPHSPKHHHTLGAVAGL